MDLEFELPTELEKQRTAYFTARAMPNMTMDEFMQFNSEVLEKFPVTAEERQQKFERFKDMPEFVL
jgi:hypothetical protein